MLNIICQTFFNIFESMCGSIDEYVVVFGLNFIFEVLNGAIMLCGCVMTSKPIWCATSNEVEWGVLDNGLLGALFDKFVNFLIAKDVDMGST